MSDQNIFETIDKAVSNLNSTKKMFLIMIITVIVLPPASILGGNLIGEFMKDEGTSEEKPRIAKLVSLVDQLEKKEITTQEYVDESRHVKTAHMYGGPGPGYYLWVATMMVYVFWIGYGIRQWIVFTVLAKKYHLSKASLQQTKNVTGAENPESIFTIVDDAMNHIKTTKNRFLIVTIAGIVIPQLLMFGFSALIVGPVQNPIVEEFNSILLQLEEGTMTTEAFVAEFRDLKSEYTRGFGIFGPALFLALIMFGNAGAWLAYGIKQYLTLHKWNDKYQKFKTKDDEINKKLLG